MGDVESQDAGLAAAYELALELEAAGLGPGDLAERLGVPIAAVPNLLAVAHAKADRSHEAISSPWEALP